MVVSFCGHSQVVDESSLQLWLQETLVTLIENGANTFLIGGYGRFDNIAAYVVKSLKTEYPHIKSILVLPYINHSAQTNMYDATIYPPIEHVPRKYAIIHRNYWMVDQSAVVIAYVLHPWGGAANTLKYAIKQKKLIIRYVPHQQHE